MIMLQGSLKEKLCQNHKLLTFQILNKNQIPHSLQRHTTLNIFVGLSKSNYQFISWEFRFGTCWLDQIGSFSDWICISKVFKYVKYIQNVQNLILDAGRISKWKVLFDSLNHGFFSIRNDFIRKSKNQAD